MKTSQAEVLGSFVNEAEEIVEVLRVSVVAPFLRTGHHNWRRFIRCLQLIKLDVLHFLHIERTFVGHSNVQLCPHRPRRAIVKPELSEDILLTCEQPGAGRVGILGGENRTPLEAPSRLPATFSPPSPAQNSG